jgi:hypothetical protein
MSGRGGTTGRAAGCPARFGRGCGRKGVPGVGVARGAAISLGGDAVRAPGAAESVEAGSGAAGIVIEAGGKGAAGVAGGMGCRGPDKI